MNEKKRILIVSATRDEINPFLDDCKVIKKNENLLECNLANIKIDFLITGLGISFTIFYLTKQLLSASYDLVINAGIAGSFSKKIQIGGVVHVVSDCFADFGIEYNEGFKTIFEEGLYNKNTFPFKEGVLANDHYLENQVIANLIKVKGITVNTVHGKSDSIDKVISKFNPDVESMEGAAFFYVCQQLGVSYYQIRSISNKVEEREKMNWDIPLAIGNLNEKLNEIIDLFCH